MWLRPRGTPLLCARYGGHCHPGSNQGRLHSLAICWKTVSHEPPDARINGCAVLVQRLDIVDHTGCCRRQLLDQLLQAALALAPWQRPHILPVEPPQVESFVADFAVRLAELAAQAVEIGNALSIEGYRLTVENGCSCWQQLHRLRDRSEACGPIVAIRV